MDKRRYNSSCVKDILEKKESATKGRIMGSSQELRENSGWEMRSLHEAFDFLERMPQLPSVENFTCIMHTCRKQKNRAYVQRLHAYMCKSGLEAHRSLGNYLVPMLVEIGNMCDAQQVFNRLVYRNEYSWTSLITGYIESGESQHALNLYEEMQEDCVGPSAHTFVALLKACARLKDTERGQEIHAEIATKGLERDLFVGNTLVNMYAKCGSLTKAQEVFDKLLVRDVVSWNALITAYVEHGLGEEAMNCFEQLQLEGVCPNALTFVCGLKACGSIGATIKGQEIHAEIARKGLLETDLVLGNALVDMYAKCCLLPKARKVFDNLPVRNVVSWNALITGYAKHGLGEEALTCFEHMQLEGVTPDALTSVCILKACGSIRAMVKGQEIHAEMARKGLLRSDPFIGNALVDMYAKCGSLAKAQDVFDKLTNQDVVSWTALIAAYAEHGLGEEAMMCFEQMQLEGVSPNIVTFICSLKACTSIGAIGKGREIHDDLATKGLLEVDPSIGSALVTMYAKCGLLTKAQEVIDILPVRSEILWNALITAYAEHGLAEKALNCFVQMQLEGIPPNATTFVSSLKACGSIGAIDKGREMHAEAARNGWFERDPFVGIALVDMYAKCGALAEAWEVFEKLSVRNVVSWNLVIAGYAHLGDSENVFQAIERMREEGIMPDGVTFLSVLAVCNHTGLVDKGQKYFDSMSNGLGITPTIEHHTCMVDLLSRAGQLDKALAMMKKMPFHPNLVVWHTVLGACRKWGNVELGREAFECAIKLDENDYTAYVLMSNIYADAHMQQDKEEIEEMREITSISEAKTEMLG